MKHEPNNEPKRAKLEGGGAEYNLPARSWGQKLLGEQEQKLRNQELRHRYIVHRGIMLMTGDKHG